MKAYKFIEPNIFYIVEMFCLLTLVSPPYKQIKKIIIFSIKLNGTLKIKSYLIK